MNAPSAAALAGFRELRGREGLAFRIVVHRGLAMRSKNPGGQEVGAAALPHSFNSM